MSGVIASLAVTICPACPARITITSVQCLRMGMRVGNGHGKEEKEGGGVDDEDK